MTSYAQSLGYTSAAIDLLKALVAEYNTDETEGFEWDGEENQLWGDLMGSRLGPYDGVEAANLAADGDEGAEFQLRKMLWRGHRLDCLIAHRWPPNRGGLDGLMVFSGLP